MNTAGTFEGLVGQVLDGRYRIDKLIGIGGMAVVFKARDFKEQRDVAIKMLKEDIAHDEEAVQRFENESRAVSMLSHPNIVGIYDILTEKNKNIKYLVMEYVEGITLRTYMDRRGVLSFEEVESYTEQILAALEHAHSRGIVHRDIKPQNIMLLKNGIVKVTDFGIAKLPDTDTAAITEQAIGTVYYISPEQAAGKRSDKRSDLYSLGILMYEMATGRLPFDDERAISVVMMQIHDKPVSPRKLNSDIPRGLETIIMSSLEKDPKNRYQSALDMFRELRKLKRRKKASVLTPSALKAKKRSEKNRAENPPSRSVTPVILGVAFALLLLGIISAFTILDRLEIGGVGRESLSVPAVEGLTYKPGETAEEVQKALEAIGLDKNYSVTVEYEYSKTVSRDCIIKQSPAPGSSRKAPCSITITVSLGTETVVVGDYTIMDWRVAKAGLRSEGFAVNIIKESNVSIQEGYVIDTDPAAGTTVEKGSAVTLRISTGVAQELIEMPDMYGRKESECVEILEKNSFTLGRVTYTRSPLAAGTVISHTPEAGENVYTAGTTVDFIVSGGPEFSTNYYPNVNGILREDAVKLLELYGFDVYCVKIKSEEETGSVVRQSPAYGEAAADTSEVTLYISGGADYSKIVKMYRLVGEKADDAELLARYQFGEDSAIRISRITVRNSAPAGTVIKQSPEAMSEVDTAAGIVYITLTVSGGPDYTVTVTVPDVTGYEAELAVEELKNEGINGEIVYVASSSDIGTVFWQECEAGTTLTGIQGEIGMKIYVSGGPDYTEPEQTTQQAEDTLPQIPDNDVR